MYAVLTYKIIIAGIVFTQCNEVEIEKSIDNLGDTSSIKLPVSFVLGNQDEGFESKSLLEEVKVGDAVEITLGYEDIYEKVEFSGYIKSISPGMPLKIELEDEIFLLRKKTVNKNFINTSLREVIQYLVEDTGVELNEDIPKVNFDKFLFKNTNSAAAIEKIKTEYGFGAYIDNDSKLFVGLREQLLNSDLPVFKLGVNTIKDDLKFITEDNIKIKIKATAWFKDNTKIEVEVGDEDGELRSLHFYNIATETELKDVAESKLKELKYSGYEGSITSFLIPFVTRGMAVKIEDDKFPQRAGSYLVDKVKITSGVSGARRIIYLGNKV